MMPTSVLTCSSSTRRAANADLSCLRLRGPLLRGATVVVDAAMLDIMRRYEARQSWQMRVLSLSRYWTFDPSTSRHPSTKEMSVESRSMKTRGLIRRRQLTCHGTARGEMIGSKARGGWLQLDYRPGTRFPPVELVIFSEALSSRDRVRLWDAAPRHLQPPLARLQPRKG